MTVPLRHPRAYPAVSRGSLERAPRRARSGAAAAAANDRGRRCRMFPLLDQVASMAGRLVVGVAAARQRILDGRPVRRRAGDRWLDRDAGLFPRQRLRDPRARCQGYRRRSDERSRNPAAEDYRRGDPGVAHCPTMHANRARHKWAPIRPCRPDLAGTGWRRAPASWSFAAALQPDDPSRSCKATGNGPLRFGSVRRTDMRRRGWRAGRRRLCYDGGRQRGESLVDRLTASLTPNGRPGRMLDVAIVALRRGEPVLLTGGDGAVLALAAEFVDDGNLARLRAVADRPLRMVVTRRRAVALGLAAAGGTSRGRCRARCRSRWRRSWRPRSSAISPTPPPRSASSRRVSAPRRKMPRAANWPRWRWPSWRRCCPRRWCCRWLRPRRRSPGGAAILPRSIRKRC